MQTPITPIPPITTTTTDTLSYRLQQMILGWGPVALVYFSTGYLPSGSTILQENWLDQMIPFSAAAIWLYMAFFVLIPYAYCRMDLKNIQWLRNAMLTSTAIAGVVFIVYPTSLHYPHVQDSGFNERLLALLAWVDTGKNCLPSLHGALTILCVWALLSREKPLQSLLAVIAGIGIFFSIIQLRRHLSTDLSAGILTGLVAGWLCSQPYGRSTTISRS